MTKKDNNKNKEPLRWNSVLGYILLIFGFLNIINFFSPIPIPTVGIIAIISGIIFSIGGLYLINRDKFSWFNLIRGNWKKLFRKKIKIDPLIPVKILKLSKDRNGILTVSIVAVELNIPIEIAEAGLNECVDYGHAALDFDMKRETKYYRFLEDLPPKSLDDSSE